MDDDILTCDQLEIGKFYEPVEDEVTDGYFYITGMNDDNSSVIGLRAERNTGILLEDVAPAGSGKFREIEAHEMIEQATEAFSTHLEVLIGRLYKAIP
jgi:hypothetical protein